MPPKAAKSKEAPVERPILGRFSSHLKIGIVSFLLFLILDSRCNWSSCLLDALRNGGWRLYELLNVGSDNVELFILIKYLLFLYHEIDIVRSERRQAKTPLMQFILN